MLAKAVEKATHAESPSTLSKSHKLSLAFCVLPHSVFSCVCGTTAACQVPATLWFKLQLWEAVKKEYVASRAGEKCFSVWLERINILWQATGVKWSRTKRLEGIWQSGWVGFQSRCSHPDKPRGNMGAKRTVFEKHAERNLERCRPLGFISPDRLAKAMT